MRFESFAESAGTVDPAFDEAERLVDRLREPPVDARFFGVAMSIVSSLLGP